MRQLWPILFLALGGAAGTLARVGLAGLVSRLHGGPWPAGTLAVNALGCLLFGTIWGVLTLRLPQLSPAWSLALLGGFCGAFTTFSTYAFDLARLGGMADPSGQAAVGGIGPALGYLLLSNVLGLGLVWLGARLLARWGAAAAGAGG